MRVLVVAGLVIASASLVAAAAAVGQWQPRRPMGAEPVTHPWSAELADPQLWGCGPAPTRTPDTGCRVFVISVAGVPVSAVNVEPR